MGVGGCLGLARAPLVGCFCVHTGLLELAQVLVVVPVWTPARCASVPRSCAFGFTGWGTPPPVYKMYTDLLCLELLLQQLRFSGSSPLVKDLLGTDEAA